MKTYSLRKDAGRLLAIAESVAWKLEDKQEELNHAVAAAARSTNTAALRRIPSGCAIRPRIVADSFEKVGYSTRLMTAWRGAGRRAAMFGRKDIGIDWRLLFRLGNNHIHAIDLIPRQDLERRIKTVTLIR